MFIELAELLECPAGHEPSPQCVVLPETMRGRSVFQGTIGCPSCRQEFPIVDGVARFGALTASGTSRSLPEATAVAVFLNIADPGGIVVLVGEAVMLGPALVAALEGVQLIGVNPPPGVEPAPSFSLFQSPDRLPFRSAVARGAVVGADSASAAPGADIVRVLKGGAHVVVLQEAFDVPGVVPLTSGAGLWVGRREGSSGPLVTLRHSS